MPMVEVSNGGTQLDIPDGKAYSLLNGTLTPVSFPISGVANNTHGYIADVRGYSYISHAASKACTFYMVGIKFDGTMDIFPNPIPIATRTLPISDYDYLMFYDMYTSGYTITYSLS